MSLYQIAFCRQQRISKSSVCLFYVLNNFYVAFQRHCCKMMLPNSALFPASILRCLQERHTVRLLVQGNMGCWCISVHPVSMLGIWCSSCHAHSDRPFGCESAHVCVCVRTCLCSGSMLNVTCQESAHQICVCTCVRASGVLWEWWFLLVAHSCERTHCCCAMFTFRSGCST